MIALIEGVRLSPLPMFEVTVTLRRILHSVLFAAAVSAPLGLSAQAPVSGFVDFNGDYSSNGRVGPYAVSPYQATLTGFNAQMGVGGVTPLVNAIIWCVDWQHWANSANDSYFSTAFTTNMTAGDGDFTKTRKNDEALYRKAAWLAEQYAFTETGLYSAVNIQGTIWNLFGGTFTGFTTITVPTTFTLTRNWYVLSDDPKDGGTSSQEYLTSTMKVVPEPSTYALMGVGLLALGVVSRRRKQA